MEDFANDVDEESGSLAQNLLKFIFLEHAIIIFRLFFFNIISSTPYWVSKEIQELHYQEKVKMEEYKLNSKANPYKMKKEIKKV